MDCRIRKRNDWVIRLYGERLTHGDGCMLTLTYEDEHLPMYNGLSRKDFDLFIRRLRKQTNKPLRFFGVGEYGTEGTRDLNPHYHLIVAGWKPADSIPIAIDENRGIRSTSVILDELWGKGRTEVGELSQGSVKYVTGYVRDKLTGQLAHDKLTVHDWRTDQIVRLPDTFQTSSRRPGLGFNFFRKYWQDIYPKDYITIDGKKFAPPTYFDKLLEQFHPAVFDQVKKQRIDKEHEEFSDSRLDAREIITQQRIDNRTKGQL